MKGSSLKERNLVEKLVEAIFEQTFPTIKTFVGHRRPDDDVWLCGWIAKKWIEKAENAQFVFVKAGETLPGSEGDPSVIHFDTGGGLYDQHKGKDKMTCSAALLAAELGVQDDPGLKSLLEMATAVDNVEPLLSTNIHYIIKGLPSRLRNENGPDWKTIQDRVYEMFDIVYGQDSQRAKSREELKKYVVWHTLPNGIKVASILWHPELREAAFEIGADVAVFTESKYNSEKFWVQIQVNRNSKIILPRVVEILRRQEAAIRHIDVEGKNLCYLGNQGEIPGWFIHQTLKLVMCGSRSHPLNKEDCTKLPPGQIVGAVNYSLGKIPKSVL